LSPPIANRTSGDRSPDEWRAHLRGSPPQGPERAVGIGAQQLGDPGAGKRAFVPAGRGPTEGTPWLSRAVVMVIAGALLLGAMQDTKGAPRDEACDREIAIRAAI